MLLKHFLTAITFWVYFPFFLLGLIFTTLCPPYSYSRQMWVDLFDIKKAIEERIWIVVGKYTFKTFGYIVEKAGQCLTACTKCVSHSLRILSYALALSVAFSLTTLWTVTATVIIVSGIVFFIPFVQVLFRGPPKICHSG